MLLFTLGVLTGAIGIGVFVLSPLPTEQEERDDLRWQRHHESGAALARTLGRK